jgi:hypothetical protein
MRENYRLAIYTAATRSYGTALTAQAQRIVSGLFLEKRLAEVLFIFVTDDPAEVEEAKKVYEAAGIAVEVLLTTRKGGENYKEAAQLLIADMRQMATQRAISWKAHFCLALDSDVLPPANAIRCMIDMILFDGGYYSVTFCPYPSQGGGAFLGGRGTPQNPILPDFYEDEKNVPKEITKKRKELLKQPHSQERSEKLGEIEKEIRALPPRQNVFASNGKKWRQRGWFDFAYPAIGKGAIVPIDWSGFGCTMMNREALALCDFTGYDGRGTEDLFINFKRWFPAGLRMACIPHCPCDHVIRDKANGGHVLIATGHADDPEHKGHLRQWRIPWTDDKEL